MKKKVLSTVLKVLCYLLIACILVGIVAALYMFPGTIDYHMNAKKHVDTDMMKKELKRNPDSAFVSDICEKLIDESLNNGDYQAAVPYLNFWVDYVETEDSTSPDMLAELWKSYLHLGMVEDFKQDYANRDAALSGVRELGANFYVAEFIYDGWKGTPAQKKELGLWLREQLKDENFEIPADSEVSYDRIDFYINELCRDE